MKNSTGAAEHGNTRESRGVLRASPRILLIGYNGANNAGSEARLLAVIEDVRAVLGPSARMTIPTLDAARQSRYLREEPDLHILPYSMLDLTKIGRLVRLHDIVLLVEGSCFMETWTSAMLLAFLRIIKCASAMRRPCLAYAVDAGRLSRMNQRRVRRQVSRTSLIITRSRAAADRLRSWGVTAPIEVTADAAFSLRMEPAEDDLPGRLWPEATSGIVGMALVDFYRWPVVLKLWGRSRDCYRWPFYFSSSRARVLASEELVRGFAAEADRIVATHNRSIALVCMEELDTSLAHRVHRQMAHPDRARVFSSCECNLSQMAALLRSLDALVSSRYHACVLAMPAGVPMVAVGHDLRIKELFQEVKLPDDLFTRHDCPNLMARLSRCVDQLLSDPEPSRTAVVQGHALLRERAMRNRGILEDFLHRSGWR
jgi:polysaccharide pyruvyl transferase WcaK-like protein